jgi:hypothetical protein
MTPRRPLNQVAHGSTKPAVSQSKLHTLCASAYHFGTKIDIDAA